MRVNWQWYDWIVVNTSAGKDSQAMLDFVCEAAGALDVLHRVVAVHADLGRVEWPGTRELAERQARPYGIRFELVRRPQGDLLDLVRARGMWPSAKARYCTSNLKRGQVYTLLTRLAAETRASGVGRPARVLNCLGLRAEESPARAKQLPFRLDTKASNGRRTVHTYLPLFEWETSKVWDRIGRSGVEHHHAYDLGLPRLSCVFCVLAPRDALVLAGRHNPDLLREYVAVEKEIGHRFRVGLSMADVQAGVEAGEVVGRVRPWAM